MMLDDVSFFFGERTEDRLCTCGGIKRVLCDAHASRCINGCTVADKTHIVTKACSDESFPVNGTKQPGES